MSSTQRLIMEQQPYLKALARNVAKTLPHHVEYEELVAFGQVGLAEAAKAFDASRGVTFTTFAHYRIRGAIFDGLRKMTWLPPAVRRSVTTGQLQDEVAQQIGERAGESQNPPPEQLAKQFAAAVERLGAVFLLSNLRDEDQGVDVEDKRLLPASLESKEVRKKLKAALSTLPENQAELVRMLYTENKSMAQVGEALGKNKSTVCRRHAEMLDALRTALGVADTHAGGGVAGATAVVGKRETKPSKPGQSNIPGGKAVGNGSVGLAGSESASRAGRPSSAGKGGEKGGEKEVEKGGEKPGSGSVASQPANVKATRSAKPRPSTGEIA